MTTLALTISFTPLPKVSAIVNTLALTIAETRARTLKDKIVVNKLSD